MPDGADETIGRLLGDAREDAGLPQSAAAKALGAAQSKIAKIELGRRRLLFVEAALLAQLYGVSISRLDPRHHQPRPRGARRARIDRPRQEAAGEERRQRRAKLSA
jgi:transcriptional regulator with XRE-family HTH domain